MKNIEDQKEFKESLAVIILSSALFAGIVYYDVNKKDCTLCSGPMKHKLEYSSGPGVFPSKRAKVNSWHYDLNAKWHYQLPENTAKFKDYCKRVKK